MSGNNVSHAQNKTRRKFLPNVQDTSLFSEALGQKIKIRVSAAGLRTIDHNGGIDAWLAKTSASKIDPALRRVRKLVVAKLEAAKA